MRPVDALLVAVLVLAGALAARATAVEARARRHLASAPGRDAPGTRPDPADRPPAAGPGQVDPRHSSAQGRLGGATGTGAEAAGRRPNHRARPPADTSRPTAPRGATPGRWDGFARPTVTDRARRLAGAGVLGRERTTVLLAVGALVGAAVVAGPAAAAVLVLAAPLGVVATRRRRRLAWRRRRQAQLPVALERMASALRGGASVPGAMTTVGDGMAAPIGPELAALGRQADAGRATADVLDAWAEAHADAASRLAATALVLAATVGAAPARAADGVAATLRERADLAAERRALGAQARMSAAVLSIAPLGFAAFLGTTDAAATRFLLGTPAGWACLVTGVTLDVLGAWWMSRATRGDDR